MSYRWTTRAQYGIKALLELSLHGHQQPLSVKTIAERQGIPAPFLEKVLGALRQAGIVRSVRGVQGGYQLAQPLTAISLAAILTALGEEIRMVGGDSQTGISDQVIQTLSDRLSQRFAGVLAEISLEDLYFDARSCEAAQSEVPEFMV